MTFKPNDFESSQVMRSLERLAQERGLIKNDPLKKIAATKKPLDFKPSESLTENIIKLSAGLRQSGFNKYADDLETQFLNYKKADSSLYGTSKEEGEDLVDAAHPEGSHTIEGILGDNVVETIVDQHLKLLKIVNKQPNGKLATNKNIFDAVKEALGTNFLAQKRVSKISLGQGEPSAAKNVAETAAETAGGVGIASGLAWLTKKIMGPKGADAEAIRTLTGILKRNPTKEEIAILREQVSKRGIQQALRQIFGKEVAQAVEQASIQSAEKALAQGAGTAAIKGVEGAAIQGAGTVAKGGLWGALVALVGKASAIGGTAIGGGAVGVGAAIAGGAIVGAIGGALAGSAIFDHFYKASDLKEAGQKLIGEAQDVADDFPEYKYVNQFERILNQIIAKYDVIGKLKSGTPFTIESLNEMKEINDLIMRSNKLAQTIWSAAMGHKDDQFLGALRGFGDVVATAKNYMEVSMKYSNAFDDFAGEATKVVQEQMKTKQTQQATTQGGDESAKLMQTYQTVINDIGKYKSIIAAKNLPNVKQLTDWLNIVLTEVNARKTSFEGEGNKEAVAKILADRFQKEIQTKIDKFKTRWMV
jgi:hypothetical protein